MKKYEFTGEELCFRSMKLYRIRAVMDFGLVKAGDPGGWIEREENLSQEGFCWIKGDARVYGCAEVFGGAVISGNACVGGNTQVFGDARVDHQARICGDAKVYGGASVYGEAVVDGASRVYGNAKIYGKAEIDGTAEICSDADVFRTDHYMTIAPIGTQAHAITFFRDIDGGIAYRSKFGSGKAEDLLEESLRHLPDNKNAAIYQRAIALAQLQIGSAEGGIHTLE